MLTKCLRSIVLFSLVVAISATVTTTAGASNDDAVLRDRKWYPLVPEGEVYEIDFPGMLHTYAPRITLVRVDGTVVRCREVTAYVSRRAYRPVYVPEANITWTYNKRVRMTQARFYGSSGDLIDGHCHIEFGASDAFSAFTLPALYGW